jgi:hypothetical protein
MFQTLNSEYQDSVSAIVRQLNRQVLGPTQLVHSQLIIVEVHLKSLETHCTTLGSERYARFHHLVDTKDDLG